MIVYRGSLTREVAELDAMILEMDQTSREMEEEWRAATAFSYYGVSDGLG